VSKHDVSHLKRRLLRDLVRENVELKENRLPRSLRRGPQRLRTAVRVLGVALVPLVLLGSTRLISSFAPSPPPVQTAPAVPQAQGPQVAPKPAAPRVGHVGDITPIDADVLPLAVRKVAIDPGHGGGSLGTHTPRGLVEKDLTLDVAVRLRKLLEDDGFQVLMTRGGDQDVSLAERGTLANKGEADIFVSIHVNWIENRQSRGVETYFLGATQDPFLSRLAAAENRESGYSMADMRQLLDRIYADVRQDNSRKLAGVVQSSLYHSLRKVNPGLEDRGVKAAPFIVLLTTEMPAILAEVSCLSNDQEADLLSRPLYRQYIAEALAEGVRSYADSVEGRPQGGPSPQTTPEKGTRSDE
jgi:N-acetylmuramoyl-L-alanine amidase